MTQICKKCGVEKPMEAFHKNDTYKSGRASTCVECRHALDKILRQTEEYKARKLAYARTEKARAAKRRSRLDVWLAKRFRQKVKNISNTF